MNLNDSVFVRARYLLVAVALSSFAFASVSFAVADDAEVGAAAKTHDHDHEDSDDDHDHDDHGHDGDSADHDEAGHVGGESHEAGSHGDEGVPPLLSFDFGSAICNLAIFLGVFFILSKFVWPVILDGLKAREQKIHGDLIEAEKANADAKALLADYQSKLDEASAKVQAMLADARKDAETSGQRIIDEAKVEAQRQSDRALADIETAKKVALSDLAGQTSDMAIAVAGQVVGRELRPEDHAELIRQSLDRLPSDN